MLERANENVEENTKGQKSLNLLFCMRMGVSCVANTQKKVDQPECVAAGVTIIISSHFHFRGDQIAAEYCESTDMAMDIVHRHVYIVCI